MQGLRIISLRRNKIFGKINMTKQYCRLRQELQGGEIKNVLLAALQRSFMTVSKGRICLTVCTT